MSIRFCGGLFPSLLFAVACGSSDDASKSGGDAGTDVVTPGTGGATGGDAAVSTGGSTSGGTGGATSTGGSAGEAGPPVPTIVAVGYAGLRVVSYDLAKTWEHKQTLSDAAADDPTLLRAVGYGAGTFVAVGHRIFTSEDGATWTEQANPEQQWLGGIAFGNDRFVATGGFGYSAWSEDGASWTVGGLLDSEPSRSLVFGNGVFMSHTDPGNWWTSTDGAAWTVDSGGHAEEIAFCNGAFEDASACGPAFGHGVYVRSGGWESGVIARSTDGTNWENVTVGFVGDVTGFAFGMAVR